MSDNINVMRDDVTPNTLDQRVTDRYKRYSMSVQAYVPDAQAAFDNGSITLSDVPHETLGLGENERETMASIRTEKRAMSLDNPVIKITKTDDGEPNKYEVVSGAEAAPKLQAGKIDEKGQQLQKRYGEMSYAEQKEFWKQKQLEGLVRIKQNRTVLDPDQITEPGTFTNVALKTFAEFSEGVFEGLENTARSATMVAHDLFPPADPLSAAWSDVMGSVDVATADLRPGVLPDIKDAEGVAYGFVRGIGQFMPSFLAFNRALSAFGPLKGSAITRGFLAGAPADAMAFDAVDGNLHDLARSMGEITIPGVGVVNMDNEYTRFMSSSTADSQAEARFRNMLEGGIIGVGFDAALKGAGIALTRAQESEMSRRISELYVQTAKNVRDFRANAATRLESKAMAEIDQMRTMRADTEGQVMMHSGLPVDEVKKRSMTAFSELAVSRLLRGDVGNFQEWNTMIRDMFQDFPERQASIETPQFKEWFAESKVTDADDIPLVVFHGTTHDISEFKPDRGNPENNMGVGYYFTNSQVDASDNYAGMGPDLTARVERQAEQLQYDVEDAIDNDGLADLLAEHGVTEDWSKYDAENIAFRLAEKELSGQQPNIVPVYLSMQNPAVIDRYGGGTKLDYEIIYDVDETRPQAREEIADENPDLSPDDEEFKDMVEDRAVDLAMENDYMDEGGSLLKFIEGLRSAARDFEDADIERAISDVMESYPDGGDLRDILEVLNKSEGIMYTMDQDGNMASAELIRQALENAGFDGIIDQTVSEKWGTLSMRNQPMSGVDEDTVHYIAFKPEQIKSAIGNVGTFDRTNPNIMLSLLPFMGAGLLDQVAAESWNNAVDYQNSLSAEQ